MRVRTDTQQQLELFASTSLCLPVLILQTQLHTSDASSHTRAQTHTVTGAQTNYHTRAQTKYQMLRRYPPWNNCSVFGIILYYRYRTWQTQTHIANTSISSTLNHTPSVSAFETRRAKTGQDRNDGLSAVLTISIQKGGVSPYQPLQDISRVRINADGHTLAHLWSRGMFLLGMGCRGRVKCHLRETSVVISL